ncbi:hypothetical protein [Stackebrandtia soli]|uniref:hypothetical protein n=1 Tax=Stackebrandtia soli TaxID=1892856 RepID=UPI0039E814E1
MAKPLNPMPPSAKTARRAIWVQALLAILLGGGFAIAQTQAPSLVPELIANGVYRAGFALGIGAVVMLLLSFCMRYQWRLLWVLLLIIELGATAGLVWAGVKGFNWFAVIGLAIPGLVVFFSLTGRVARRWFGH